MNDMDYKVARAEAIKNFEYSFLVKAIARHGSVTIAAREIGIDRVYMHRIMRKYGIHSPAQGSSKPLAPTE